MKKNIKIILLILVMLCCVKNNIFAATSIDGLSEKPPNAYNLQLEIFGNDANKYIINIHPVNILSISYYSNYMTGKPTKILETKLTDEEYKNIYQKAYNTLREFKIPEKPHLTQDASHFKLLLNVNRREISVTYYSVSHIKEVSSGFYDILEIVNKYLPKNKKLKF